MARPTRLAAVHAAPVWLDTDATLDKAVSFIAEAGDQDVDLLVFPEVFLPGFPYWINCYAPITFPPAQERYASASITSDGPEMGRLREAADAASVEVVLGFSERDGGTLYNAQAFIGRDGELRGVHRKLVPTHAERTVWGRGDGSGLRVWQTPLGDVGGLVCWEHTMDLARHALTVQGQEIHAASWPSLDSLQGWDGLFSSQVEAMCRSHALAGQCFVVVAMSPVDDGAVTAMEEMLGPQPFMTSGGAWSAIINPMTAIVGGPRSGSDEGLLVADVDLDEIRSLHTFVDVTGHSSRPDVLRLHHDLTQRSGSMPIVGD